MDTWRKVLPDYELMLWNFDRFPKSQSQWVSDAFDNKKYAFAADYIRLYSVYTYGGIYLDMDVIVKKSFDPFLSLNSMLGLQHDDNSGLEVAAFGAEKNSSWVKECLDFYNQRSFIKKDRTMNTTVMPLVIDFLLKDLGYDLVSVRSIEDALRINGQEKRIPVFPKDFFSPKSYYDGIVYETENTICIHNFAQSWRDIKRKPERKRGNSFKDKTLTAIQTFLLKTHLHRLQWEIRHMFDNEKYPLLNKDVKIDKDFLLG